MVSYFKVHGDIGKWLTVTKEVSDWSFRLLSVSSCDMLISLVGVTLCDADFLSLGYGYPVLKLIIHSQNETKNFCPSSSLSLSPNRFALK